MKAVQWIGISLVGLLLVACGSEEAPKTKAVQTQSPAATSTVAVKKPEMPANHEQIKQALTNAQSAEGALGTETLGGGQLTADNTAEPVAGTRQEPVRAKTSVTQTTAALKEAPKKVVMATDKLAKAVETKQAPQVEATAMVATVAGDAVKGKALARKCVTCHNLNERKKVGPGLKGIVGRPAGIMADMKYSKTLKQGGWAWDEAKLASWLCDSKKAVKVLSGDAKATTKMPSQRICDAQKQADLIAFLKTL